MRINRPTHAMFAPAAFADDKKVVIEPKHVCEPSRLLEMRAHLIFFEIDPDTGRKVKKICRYQQYRAVNKAVQRVATGEYRKGLIWHTQGSDKSPTMVLLALKLKTHLTLDAPNVLLI